jgi:hypothetical protein
MSVSDGIGWIATAVFLSSYASKRPGTLRRIQALAAILWMIYGLIIHAVPVIVANAIVACVAMWSSLRQQGRTPVSEPSTAIRQQAWSSTERR